MGTKPRFDGYGRLCGADLIPLAELGRPRIDVVMTLSGIFRDLLPLQTRMLAEAAFKAATADEAPEMNFVRAHALDYAEKMGVGMEEASLRVFSNAEGAYGSNVNQLVDSGAWGEEDELADAYQARKSFAYGMDGKAHKNAGLLQAALKDVDLAYQNLESVELGVTTVDHYFDTLGGISRAVKRAKGGQEAPVFIGDQTRGAGKVRTLKDQVALETRSRSLNPKWFEGLLKHGHEGVRMIEAQVTNTLGWSATTGQVDPWVYQRLSETFVLDEEMRRRMAALNPQASVRMANRLIEAFERNYWQPDEATLAALQAGADELEDTLEGLTPGMAAE
jgi:magnesium chelatase subunit H